MRGHAAPSEARPAAKFGPIPEWAGTATRAVHAGRRPDLNAGAIAPPIVQTSTFHFPAENSESRDGGGVYLYTRHDNPTQEVAAEILRSLEGAESARVFGSGMGAITTTLLALLRSGDEVVALESLYGGTVGLLTDLLPRMGVNVRLVTDDEAADPERCVTESTKVVYVESPTNPTLRVHDLAAWARAADRVGAISVVDNTFATPVLQSPLAMGMDLVIHSGTKYLGGHSDLIAGAVAGPRILIDRIRATHIVVGSVLDPFAAFLLARGMRTLPLRVQRQTETAARLVEELQRIPAVERVCYPGIGSEAEAAIVARQMRGRGGMLSFVVRGGLGAAREVLGRFRLIQAASSLGGVESLASLPRETSHALLSPEERQRRGIAEGMIRLSVGIEESEDLVRDLAQALHGSSASAASKL
ncbi:MAG TPA: aminotransferase class I/II-fold pyridoxal phosphate-dependent enzyme [Thermoplasmata archaeon]|nr:aminotransferase class I/II-fold pyridoxal phosphate-dependent enzyme [Thermoplasmata archaeon]